jgi:hypothetical protein
VRRLRFHRPSAATIISLVALFFAMSGTAVAATGGNFLLGKSNTATAVSSLSNTKGTALSLSSTATTPPLKVSNSVQVPNLNASELGGHPASGFIQGGGAASDARLTLPFAPGNQNLIAAPGSVVSAACTAAGGDQLNLSGSSATNVTATWWSKDAISQDTTVNDTVTVFLNGAAAIEGTDVIVLQVDAGSSISTYTLTESFNSGTSSCLFTGQVVTTNG